MGFNGSYKGFPVRAIGARATEIAAECERLGWQLSATLAEIDATQLHAEPWEGQILRDASSTLVDLSSSLKQYRLRLLGISAAASAAAEAAQ
jgi:hypothetical protein